MPLKPLQISGQEARPCVMGFVETHPLTFSGCVDHQDVCLVRAPWSGAPGEAACKRDQCLLPSVLGLHQPQGSPPVLLKGTQGSRKSAEQESQIKFQISALLLLTSCVTSEKLFHLHLFQAQVGEETLHFQRPLPFKVFLPIFLAKRGRRWQQDPSSEPWKCSPDSSPHQPRPSPGSLR